MVSACSFVETVISFHLTLSTVVTPFREASHASLQLLTSDPCLQQVLLFSRLGQHRVPQRAGLSRIRNNWIPYQCPLRAAGNWDEVGSCPIFFLGIQYCDSFSSCCQKQVSHFQKSPNNNWTPVSMFLYAPNLQNMRVILSKQILISPWLIPWFLSHLAWNRDATPSLFQTMPVSTSL